MNRVLAILLVVTFSFSGSLGISMNDRTDDSVSSENHEKYHPDYGAITGEHSSSKDGSNEPFGVRFVCPRSSVSDETGQSVQYDHFCPFYLYDPTDIMSQPVLMVDPNRSDYIAFNALHGGRGIVLPTDTQPPSDQSRDNDVHQPHTTWLSSDEGSSWTDDRYYAPSGLTGEERRLYGENNAATMDSSGNIYLSSLYAFREGDSEDYDYAVVFWNGGRANRPMDYLSGYTVHYIESGHSVDRIHSTYLRESNRILTTWLQTTPEGDSWVRGFWTQPGRGSAWYELPEEARIGPCKNITNSLSSSNGAYIGCSPADGYVVQSPRNGHKTNSTNFSYQMHIIHPENWTQQYVSSTPVHDGFGLLVRMDDRWGHQGNMAIVSSGVDSEGAVHVEMSHGLLGAEWANIVDFSDPLRETGLDRTLIDARVTDAAYLAESGNFHMIYAERYEPNQVGGDMAGLPMTGEPEFHKTYAVGRIVAEGRFSGSFDLQYGNRDMVSTHAGSMSPERRGESNAIFWDQHDSIVVWTDPESGLQRTFVAFGDYGYIRFAEVVEDNPPIPIPLPAVPVPPVPLAAAGTNPATIGAAAGILFGLMLTMMMAAKKRKPLEVPHT